MKRSATTGILIVGLAATGMFAFALRPKDEASVRVGVAPHPRINAPDGRQPSPPIADRLPRQPDAPGRELATDIAGASIASVRSISERGETHDPAAADETGATTGATFATKRSANPSSSTTPPSSPAAKLPLSVVAADQTESLTPLQTTALSQLAEDFLVAVDSPSTETPEAEKKPALHREKDAWERERELNDARYLAQFGQESFNAMLLRRALAESGQADAP